MLSGRGDEFQQVLLLGEQIPSGTTSAGFFNRDLEGRGFTCCGKTGWRCPSLIPAGDPYSSRGQRPRKTCPQPSPTLKGSSPVESRRTCIPRPGPVRPLQARESNATPSGGVAPGYFLVPLQGPKCSALACPMARVFDITEGRHPANNTQIDSQEAFFCSPF